MKHPGMINKVYNISDDIFNWSEENFKKASDIINFIYHTWVFHRSISPNTISRLPKIAAMSAIK